MQVVTARRLQLAGHRPLLLVGGATGQIGDPKEAGERTLNPPEVVAGWVERIRDQVAPFVDVRRATTRPRWSTTWTGPRRCRRSSSCATSASTSRSTRCSPARSSRPGWRPGISFTEFSYQLLQSHDFFELHRGTAARCSSAAPTSGATSPPGSTTSAAAACGPVHAFTTPLVTKADGTKFGKTEGGVDLARRRR